MNYTKATDGLGPTNLITRKEWRNNKLVVRRVEPVIGSRLTLQIAMKDGTFGPWTASDEDIRATDWEFVR